MKTYRLIFLMSFVIFSLAACEDENDPGNENGSNDNDDNGNGIAKSETSIQIEETEYAFDLTGEEITDDVVFMDTQVSIKLVNEFGHTLQVKLAGPDIYDKNSQEFLADPNIPFEVEENIASITLFNPNEVPLTNDATKYLIDGIVSVNKLTSSEIELSYDGEGFPGGNFANNTEGRFDVKLEFKLTNFELLDIRN